MIIIVVKFTSRLELCHPFWGTAFDWKALIELVLCSESYAHIRGIIE
jgi:hypothetical protein